MCFRLTSTQLPGSQTFIIQVRAGVHISQKTRSAWTFLILSLTRKAEMQNGSNMAGFGLIMCDSASLSWEKITDKMTCIWAILGGFAIQGQFSGLVLSVSKQG